MRLWSCFALMAMAGFSLSAGPEDGSFGPGQVIADEVRQLAEADFAFIPGGILQVSTNKSTNLSQYLSVKDEKLTVVKLTGKLILASLERSVSLLPSSNPSFLQISGLKVTYDPTKFSDRILKVESDSGSFDLNKTYEVAMPETMAKGGFGFFTIWDSKAIVKTLPATINDAIKDKAFQNSPDRYTVRSGE